MISDDLRAAPLGKSSPGLFMQLRVHLSIRESCWAALAAEGLDLAAMLFREWLRRWLYGTLLHWQYDMAMQYLRVLSFVDGRERRESEVVVTQKRGGACLL